MNPLWNPKSDIEDKNKTGDLEQVRILHAAYLSVSAPGKNLLHSEKDSKALSSEVVNSLQPLGAIDIERSGIEVAQKAAQKLSGMVALKDMWGAISQKLGPAFNQFVVNLALFDFRTTGGGRARKSTSYLRIGADPHYARPFAGDLPVSVDFLLKTLKHKRPRTQASFNLVITSKKELKYLPPTRFTATFPLLLAGAQNNKPHKALVTPQLPGTSHSSPAHIQYSDLGSFGFAEPGYCTWEKVESTETAGTRLSLGAYVLDTDYLDELLALMKRMGPSDKKNYLNYGGVGENHVTVLRDLFMGSNGPALAFKWLFQLVDAAMALCTEADKSTPLLRAFFLLMRQKIDVRTMKLQDLQQKGVARNPNYFDYLWVFESTLWEFLFLAATCLPMKKIVDTLKTQKRLKPLLDAWEPSVGLSEGTLREPIKVGDHGSFDRFYFPSGTAAADALYEALWASKIGPFAMGTDLNRLSTFTPYFEFYQGNGMLNPKELTAKAAGGAGRPEDCTATQLWLNLSDGLHERFLNQPDSSTVGVEIAALVLAHVQTLLKNRPAPIKGLTISYSTVYLVIDYTKFASDIPNGHLYPILAQLRDSLLKSGTAQGMKEVIFLRSNLKYNTGSLDRYQSGELLLFAGGNTQALAAKLAERAQDSFKGGWALMDEYIPMMKKVYLLSDAIGFARWGAYTQLWQGYKGPPGAVTVAREFSAMKNTIVRLITHPLEPIFTNLVNDMKSNSFKPLLTPGTRQKISTFWTRLSNDRTVLTKMSENMKGLGEAARKFQEIIGYFEPTLQEIISEMLQAKKTLPVTLHKDTQQQFHAYLSRLQAAKTLVEEAKLQSPGVTSAPHEDGPPPVMDRPKMHETGFFALKNTIVRLITHPLEPIFTNLVNDMKSNSFKPLLTPGTRQKITTLWTRLSNDRAVLAQLGEHTKEVGEAGRKVQEVIGYFEPMLEEIISEMLQAKKTLPVTLHKGTQQQFHAYLSRLQAAKTLVEEAKLQSPQEATKPKLAI